MERIENDKFARRVYVGGCTGNRLLRKRWIDGMKECLRKRSLYVGHARRMVQDRCE